MTHNIIKTIILLLGLTFLSTFSRTTFNAPDSVSASYSGGTVIVKVYGGSVGLSKPMYHAVLLSDLSLSLERAYPDFDIYS